LVPRLVIELLIFGIEKHRWAFALPIWCGRLEMKIRGLFVTIVPGLAAAEGFLIDKGSSFSVGPVKVLYATFIPLLGIVDKRTHALQQATCTGSNDLLDHLGWSRHCSPVLTLRSTMSDVPGPLNSGRAAAA
jgi:hypothetical protein